MPGEDDVPEEFSPVIHGPWKILPLPPNNQRRSTIFVKLGPPEQDVAPERVDVAYVCVPPVSLWMRIGPSSHVAMYSVVGIYHHHMPRSVLADFYQATFYLLALVHNHLVSVRGNREVHGNHVNQRMGRKSCRRRMTNKVNPQVIGGLPGERAKRPVAQVRDLLPIGRNFGTAKGNNKIHETGAF